MFAFLAFGFGLAYGEGSPFMGLTHFALADLPTSKYGFVVIQVRHHHLLVKGTVLLGKRAIFVIYKGIVLQDSSAIFLFYTVVML